MVDAVTDAGAAATGAGSSPATGGTTLVTAVAADPAKVAADAAAAAAQTPEQKAAAEAAAKVKTGAPETYADFTLPDGATVDKAALDAVAPMFKEFGLSQEQAQKLVEWDAGRQKAAGEAQTKAWETQTAKWGEDAKADKEIGGVALDQNVAHAVKFLGEFASPALREILDSTGLGNHPELIRVFSKAGKAMAEDKFVSGGAARTDQPKTAASVLYPDLPA